MKRWPVIRHIRYFWGLYHVNKHYEVWAALGSHDGGRVGDHAVLDAIWRGEM